jgi:hypothetical protein
MFIDKKKIGTLTLLVVDEMADPAVMLSKLDARRYRHRDLAHDETSSGFSVSDDTTASRIDDSNAYAHGVVHAQAVTAIGAIPKHLLDGAIRKETRLWLSESGSSKVPKAIKADIRQNCILALADKAQTKVSCVPFAIDTVARLAYASIPDGEALDALQVALADVGVKAWTLSPATIGVFPDGLCADSATELFMLWLLDKVRREWEASEPVSWTFRRSGDAKEEARFSGMGSDRASVRDALREQLPLVELGVCAVPEGMRQVLTARFSIGWTLRSLAYPPGCEDLADRVEHLRSIASWLRAEWTRFCQAMDEDEGAATALRDSACHEVA